LLFDSKSSDLNWLRFRYASQVIPADMNIGGTINTTIPLRKAAISLPPLAAAWV
jgi:hypothetical protein